MCLAIPAEIVEFLADGMARVRSTASADDLRHAARRLEIATMCSSMWLRAEQDRPAGARAPSTCCRDRVKARSCSMKYVDEYRDGRVARTLGPHRPSRRAGPDLSFMNFARHTHAISRYGSPICCPATFA